MDEKHDWMLGDYRKQSDDILQQGIKWQTELISELEASIIQARNERLSYYHELQKRTAAAYFKAHPELLPLKVGYKLLGTHDMYPNGFNLMTGVYRITGIEPQRNNVFVEDTTGCMTLFHMETAQLMRRLYLEDKSRKQAKPTG